MRAPFRLLEFASATIRRQLALAFALTTALVMFGLGYVVIAHQSRFLMEQSVRSARTLAHSVAVSSTAWVVANDVVGLQYELRSIARDETLRYALVLARDGTVLASNREQDIGMVVQDRLSMSLLESEVSTGRILINQKNLVEAVEPVFAGSRHIGWVRIGLGRERLAANLEAVAHRVYILAGLGIAFTILLAVIISGGLTRSLRQLTGVAEAVHKGQRNVRASLGRNDEIGLLALSINSMLDALAGAERERLATENEIRSLAFYDPLTHLPNRRLLIERLRHALAASGRSGQVGALLFIDLDNFKTLNDSLGHDMGDQLLQQVAARLVHGVREGDTVARLGGDEFVIVLETLGVELHEAARHAQSIGRKLLGVLGEPYELAGRPHRSTSSIGVALFEDHHHSIDELMKRADLAMYNAKTAGRNTLRFFDPQMQTVVNQRAMLENGLREALQQGQFVLYYQSQHDERGRVSGAEALLRWLHPERGMVPPNEFIALAEETGLIIPVGLWVLESACRQLAAWSGQETSAGLTLAVNISVRQFRQPEFVDQVLQALFASGADPALLKLEMTESLLMDNVEEVIEKMCLLQERGVGFSLDDFGTGYSSLSYLKRLPLEQLKIDQSFVRELCSDANDAAIASTIVALAHHMGMGVIAEGVETSEQEAFLKALGCRAFQGYLYGRPLPIIEFEQKYLLDKLPA